ncbi:UDP-N-acetylglucosamine diphosphorylase/glucosamine-1-phosphate N-acetyltransferase [Alkalilimnicola ehrlichii]|uniref:Bifunctional protein GlmU n=1 Tax=Alkalilimnicola ehrlichii TaxID=351052 RepID=A0A3E0X1Z5_9GAMM|nr:bifunctional UDP-N-acetylglucosamine diphosphorylase/glucosamine-1-phosphate N-acetyltransferase GlmU [Alkalilimnicola ehrlichii]RFA30632.1 UDP-N-acetylglucosamine diphosphorylase/glucosamine-1-phosphate N-acetyltransferase [Alkalilimnicola ehrlichii]RFA38213.1 UDP-N-acetylglucosamine diphosphorylase/glucosamine-1-phosphate N-acetyltransferase [Alkalilimnicola ehrlichii]
MKLAVTILAAGQGSRMRSRLPKVLHPLGGRPLLGHVLHTARALNPDGVYVVYGHGGDTVRAQIDQTDIVWVEQDKQLGTGDAVARVLPQIDDDTALLVLYGDVPLVRAETLRPLVEAAVCGRVGLLTATPADPKGYGRIVRNHAGEVQAIVEEKDASEAQKTIGEVNTGLLAAPAKLLRRWLGALSNDNAQGEYYLTDIVAAAVEDGVEVAAYAAEDFNEVLGVNDRAQLAHLERVFQLHQAHALMREGMTLADPCRFDLRGTLRIGQDCAVDINVVFEGEVSLGDEVIIGPNCYLKNVSVADGVTIEANSVLENAIIGPRATIGPFARIRPGTELKAGAKVGNFVEIKQALLEEGAKVNHLSYIGDAEIGPGTNVGAGTITCNYDGARKHRTTVGANAFIGSGTQLVAPVTVGDGATIGAGSTITKNAPAEQLTITRVKQLTVRGWSRPQKDK